MREDRWLQFKGNGLETGPPWPSRGSVEGGFPEGGCQLPQGPAFCSPSSSPGPGLFLTPPFLACSSKTKERLTEFSEDEAEKNQAWSRTHGETRYKDLNPHLTPTDTISRSLVPSTALSSLVHVEIENDRLSGRQRIAEVLGAGQGPGAIPIGSLRSRKGFLHTSKDLAEDTEPWGLGLTQAHKGSMAGE